MTNKIPTPDETTIKIPTPEEARATYTRPSLIKKHIIHLLQRYGGAVFFIEDLMRDEFPPLYYAKSKYYAEYLSCIEKLAPEFVAAGWTVKIDKQSDTNGNITKDTSFSITPTIPEE